MTRTTQGPNNIADAKAKLCREWASALDSQVWSHLELDHLRKTLTICEDNDPNIEDELQTLQDVTH